LTQQKSDNLTKNFVTIVTQLKEFIGINNLE